MAGCSALAILGTFQTRVVHSSQLADQITLNPLIIERLQQYSQTSGARLATVRCSQATTLLQNAATLQANILASPIC